VNALLLLLVGEIIPCLRVPGFWSAFFGAIIISIVSWVLSAFFRGSDGRVHVLTHHTQIKTVRGRVRYVGPSVRKQTRDAVIEAVVDNAGHDLRPGMFVTAELALGQMALPAVPETAVRAEGTLRHVFLVQAGRIEDRLVQVAEPREGLVPVVSGLKAGEQVVADLTPEVRDGARVK
jgi:RND family efflux transporter MFP subunit